MEIEIKEKKEQKLLSRLEVEAKIVFINESTPSNDKVQEAIAKKIGKDMKLVVIKHIYTSYGDSSAEVLAYVYNDEKKLDEIEVTHKKGAKDGEGEKEGEEKPAEAPEEKKAEAPVEKAKPAKKEAPKEGE